jgi:hypothetical protein
MNAVIPAKTNHTPMMYLAISIGSKTKLSKPTGM